MLYAITRNCQPCTVKTNSFTNSSETWLLLYCLLLVTATVCSTEVWLDVKVYRCQVYRLLPVLCVSCNETPNGASGLHVPLCHNYRGHTCTNTNTVRTHRHAHTGTHTHTHTHKGKNAHRHSFVGMGNVQGYFMSTIPLKFLGSKWRKRHGNQCLLRRHWKIPRPLTNTAFECAATFKILFEGGKISVVFSSWPGTLLS